MEKYGVIVDAFSSGSLLAPEFIKKGYKIIHVRSSKEPYHLYANTPFHKEDFVLDLFEENLDALCKKLKKYPIQFVLSGTEPGVELADSLGEKLGVVGNGTKLSHVRRTKYDMIDTLKKAGLKTAKQIKTASTQEAIAFAKSLPTFDIILKPEKGAANSLVFRARNEKEATYALHEILTNKTTFGDTNTDACVQEYLIGEKYAVNTVSCNGKCVVTDIIKYKLSDINGVSNFYDYDEILSPKDGPVLTALEEYTIKAVLALGINWGPAHPEIMYTKDGPVAIEVNSRIAGAGLPRLERDALGFGQVDYTIAAYTNPKEFHKLTQRPVKLINHCLMVYLNSKKKGVLKSTKKFNQLKKLPSFSRLLLEVEVGDIIKKTRDLDTVIGFVYLVHKDQNQVMKDYETIRAIESKDLYENIQ